MFLAVYLSSTLTQENHHLYNLPLGSFSVSVSICLLHYFLEYMPTTTLSTVELQQNLWSLSNGKESMASPP